MKKLITLLSIMTFMVFLTTSPVTAETLKIGVFDLQRVIKDSKTVEGYRQRMGKEADAKKKLFSEKQNTVRQTEEKLRRENKSLQAQERKALDEKLREEIRELQRLKEDIEIELKKSDRELTEKTMLDINKVIEQIFDKESYSIIFEKNAAGAVKFKNSLDITDKIIKAYDTK